MITTADRPPIVGLTDLDRIKQTWLDSESQYERKILVCSGAGCISSKCSEVSQAFRDELALLKLSKTTTIHETGCMGICAVGPVALVLPERTFYTNLTPEKARTIIKKDIAQQVLVTDLTFFDTSLQRHVPCIDDIGFFKEQVRIALRNCGEMPYNSLEAYIARDGYRSAITAVTTLSQEQVIEELAQSGQKVVVVLGFQPL